MIDVRVRRENQLGWRPHPSWIKEHLGALPRYPRELLGEMSKQYMAHQRSGQRSSVPSVAVDIHEPAMDGWQDGPGATGLELDMDDLEGAREQDAPPPVRPQLDDRVEPDSRWMEDFAPVEARAESPEVLEPSSVPTPVPEAAPPRVPVVSRVDPSSPFGRIARRSIDASNAQASEPVASPPSRSRIRGGGDGRRCLGIHGQHRRTRSTRRTAFCSISGWDRTTARDAFCTPSLWSGRASGA